MKELSTDATREGTKTFQDATRIYVRAKSSISGGWGSFDIAELDQASLVEWLRSHEGAAERVLLQLLGW